MPMCRVFSCVVGRGCLLWPVHFLGKTLLVFALLHSVFQGQICLLNIHIYITFIDIYIYIYTHTYAFFRKLNYFEKTVRKLKCQVNEPPRDNNHILSLKERSMIKHYCSSFYFTYVGYWICLVGYTDTHKFFNSKSFRG